jgi:hypothetical protein
MSWLRNSEQVCFIFRTKKTKPFLSGNIYLVQTEKLKYKNDVGPRGGMWRGVFRIPVFNMDLSGPNFKYF